MFLLAIKLQSLFKLFLILQSCVNSKETPTRPSQIVQKLNTAYRTNLNIIISSENNLADSTELQFLETPTIQIKLPANFSNKFHLLGKFTKKTMIIVYIKTIPIDAQLAELLPELLKKLHELHMVFITSEEPRTWQEDLYSYCFQRGFINVLLVHQTNQTVKLYSYHPYPVIRNMQLMQLEDYLNRWRQLRNLQMFPIRTVVMTIEPRMFEYVNRRGKSVYAGYMYEAIKEFSRRHNASLRMLEEVPKENIYNSVSVLLTNKIIDVLFYIYDLHSNQSSTAPIHLVKMNIAVPYARPIANYLYFARPFTWGLWLAVVGTIGYGMLMLYASKYPNSDSEIGEYFLSSWCHLLFIPQTLMTFANWQQLAIHFLMMLSGFILTNFYLALLSSMLTSGLFEPQYNTFEDLVRAPYPLLLDDYYAKQYTQENLLPAGVRKKIQIVHPMVLNAHRIALNTSYMYTGYMDRMEGILEQQRLLKVPRFKLLTQSITDALLAYPVAAELPYLNMLNVYLRRIFECGILAKMKSDAWQDTMESGLTSLIRTESIELKPFNLEFYYYAFGLWALGLTLATLCFLLELFRFYIGKSQKAD